jgi:hypothetical protein
VATSEHQDAAGLSLAGAGGLLGKDPDVEPDLRLLVEEVAAGLPAGAVSAASHSLVAGRDDCPVKGASIFDLFFRMQAEHQIRYRFGREPDGNPALPWA